LTLIIALFPSEILATRSHHAPTAAYGTLVANGSSQRASVAYSVLILPQASALTHRVSPERLREISKSIPKVLIITGGLYLSSPPRNYAYQRYTDDDHLVDPVNSQRLKNDMPEAEYIQWTHCGHAFHAQHPKRFHELLERVFVEGRNKLDGSNIYSS